MQPGFFLGFSTWGYNRITIGVQAKLGPIGRLWFGSVTSLLQGLTPPPNGGSGKIPGRSSGANF